MLRCHYYYFYYYYLFLVTTIFNSNTLISLPFTFAFQSLSISTLSSPITTTTTTTTTSISTSFVKRRVIMAPRSKSNNDAIDEENLENNAIRIGFIGCGTIASAIATGIATQKVVPIESITVTKRSESKSLALQKEFPNLVSIHDNAQSVVNESDIVFLCVLPQQASSVVQQLEFDATKHKLVSLVSTSKVNDLIQDSKLPPASVTKMICFPSVAKHVGVCLHYAPHYNETNNDNNDNIDILTTLFKSIGGVLTVTNEEQYEACMVTTCIMGPWYGLMNQCQEWLVNKGNLSPDQASYLVIQQTNAAIFDAATRNNNKDDNNTAHLLKDLIKEQTPGGLNEQALRNFDSLNGLSSFDRVMDAVHSRIQGKSDGSLMSNNNDKE